VGFTGIRGVVSLVAALPYRDGRHGAFSGARSHPVFVTFCVILVSLVGQGAALPKVIEYLGLDKAALRGGSAKRNEVTARVAGIRAGSTA